MVGPYIRKIRKEKGYLLKDMATYLEVDPTILSKMEREERVFKKADIIKLADYLEISEDSLLIIWLSDKIYNLVQGENTALEAIELAKKRQVNNE